MITKYKVYEDNIQYVYPNQIETAIDNTIGAVILNKEGWIKLDVSRYQKPEQAGDWSVRGGVFYLPEIKSPYSSYYKSNKHYGGKEFVTGTIVLYHPYIVRAGTGGTGPNIAYKELYGKDKYLTLEYDVVSTIMGDVDVSEVQELLNKYDCDGDVADFIVDNSRQGNQLRTALQEHIIGSKVKDKGYDSILSYSINKGQLRLSELFYLNQEFYPDESGFYID